MNRYVTDVVNRVVNDIMNGTPPWYKSWRMVRPVNATTKKTYRGINTLLLWGHYPTNEWAGYQQWKKAGAQVRKGEKGTPIIFYKPPELDSEGLVKYGGVYRVSKVWNAEQVDGYDAPPPPQIVGNRNAAFDKMIKDIGIEIKEGGDQPLFSPTHDRLEMPAPNMFQSMDHYYQTLGHEAIHWTGGAKRLERIMVGNKFTIESEADRGREELVAEIGGSALYGYFGFDTPIDEMRDSAYIAGWMKAIPADERCNALMYASREATAAFDYLVPEPQENSLAA